MESTHLILINIGKLSYAMLHYFMFSLAVEEKAPPLHLQWVVFIYLFASFVVEKWHLTLSRVTSLKRGVLILFTRNLSLE